MDATREIKQRLRDVPAIRRVLYRLRGGKRETRLFKNRIDFERVEIPYPDLFVGTHHKTGTVWLETVFRRFARLSQCNYLSLSRDSVVLEKPIEGPRPRRIVFDHHSRFEGVDFATGRGLRMVRDPRDVVISSMHYHRRAHEPWLHEKGPDGRTYQERLNALTSDEDGYLFELDNAAGRAIADMLAFDGGETVRTVRYEDLIDDADMLRWHDLLHWVGLRSADLILCQQALFENSLFGLAGNRSHVRSGAKRQWEKVLSERVLARVEELFPGAPARLGYAA